MTIENSRAARDSLPDADYVEFASRLDLTLDGGFAVAVPSRLRLLEAAGAKHPLMLSVDPGAPEVQAERRRAFIAQGLVGSADRMRNLFDDAIADPSWLYAAAAPGEATPGVHYRTVTDAAGAPFVSLPVFANDPAWHLSTAAVVVHTPDGDLVLHGFGALYLAWLAHIAEERRTAAGDPDRLFVVICEARQMGELLAGWDDPRVRIVHGIHNSHLPPPYDDPDAPLEGLWQRWLALLDRFDAVLWPTASQRDDIVARFGAREGFAVVPNPVAMVEEPVDPASRDSRGVAMINRLADQKRVDLGIRAWRDIVAAVPDARLDIHGDGPLREQLQTLIDDLGLSDSVQLHGHLDNRWVIYDTAALLMVSSAFEGQSIVVGESLAHGLPVVSFDVRYGPRDTLGGGGVLVPPGDVAALADAVITVLRDDGYRAQLSRRAREAAYALSTESVQRALVAALRGAVERPSRRAPHS